jgi:hypothetical protein
MQNRQMLNNYGLRFAAFAEHMSEVCAHYWAVFVRRIVLPLLLWRGRDMVLLTNGQWVDASPEFQATDVTWIYDSITHRLTKARLSPTAPVMRWKWLGAVSVARARDMSDFFSDLRISRGEMLADAKVIDLFIHQKGWNPGSQLRVIDRMTAEEHVVWAYGDGPAAPSSSAEARELDYIR